MICPKCGHNNEENAGLCIECNYRFEVGHAFNDASNVSFIPINDSKKSKFLRYTFFAIFLLFFIFMILKNILLT